MRLFVTYLLAVSGMATSANAQSVVGKWAVTWDADISIDHDTAIVKSRKPATLDLTQRGDSIFGVWTTGPSAGIPVRGTFDGRSLNLSSGVTERAGMIDGKPTPMKVRWDISGSVQASKISGVLMLYLGALSPVPRRWEAQRAP